MKSEYNLKYTNRYGLSIFFTQYTRRHFVGITKKIKKSLNIPKGNQKEKIEVQTIQWPKEKEQTMICKTLNRKLTI
jgi:predicted AAA+ superfamily ATPase